MHREYQYLYVIRLCQNIERHLDCLAYSVCVLNGKEK